MGAHFVFPGDEDYYSRYEQGNFQNAQHAMAP
jgi:hypothetical protein